MVGRTTKSQVLPQQEPEVVEQVHYCTPIEARQPHGINGLGRLAGVFLVLVSLIPCITLAGSVVWAVVQLIQGVPDWWVTLLLGLFAATMSAPVSGCVLLLLYGIIWLLCFGGVCELTNRAIVAGRSITCPPPRPSSDDATGSCFVVGITLFWNTITWFMVFNLFFVSDGGTYSLDPEGVPMVLVLFFLPFMMISISLLLFCLFGGPLRHLTYYLLCCCCRCCPSAAGTRSTVETEMTKLEKEDDDEEATVATCGLSLE
jgi:hypothetical protein